MKHRILSILALVGLLTAPAAFAQSSTHSPFQQPEYYAVDYGQWAIKSQSANTYLFSPQGLCVASAAGSQFFPFATNAPVLINDATPANSEVVTPSAVTNASSQCGFTASPSNNHFSFQVVSGTAGLQEALNALASPATAYPAKINIDRNWYVEANSVAGTSGATIIAAAKGNAHAFLADITTVPVTNYVWTGTAYSSTSAAWVNVAPTAAAGTAAGTSPTISDAGTALATTVSLTSGTATTTGSLFTVTWGSGHGFTYAPTGCTVTSNGPNSFTAFTIAVTGTTTPVLTVTATSAPTVSTAYKFSVTGCK